jgi:hypothetical protein
VADERPIHERLLDLAVYVPIGIASSIVEELPSLAEKGRKQVAGQFQIARMLGKLTVSEAQRRMAKATGAKPADSARATTESAARVSTAAPPAPSPAPAPARAPRTAPPRARAARPAQPPPATRPAQPPPAAEDVLPETPEDGAGTAAEAPVEARSVLRDAAPGTAQGSKPKTEAAPDVSALPIPGYDTLAASQVVQRLASLRPDELDAVRRYEVATRGRRTILHRIGQLTSSDGRATA